VLDGVMWAILFAVAGAHLGVVPGAGRGGQELVPLTRRRRRHC